MSNNVPTPDPQTASSTLAPSFVRTFVPILAGLFGTFLLDQFALNLDENLASAFIAAAITAIYYVVARFLEVFASDKWGYVLGFRKLPVYAAPDGAVPPVRDERGSATIAATLFVCGLVLVVTGLLVGVMLLVAVGAVLGVLGGVLGALDQSGLRV